MVSLNKWKGKGGNYASWGKKWLTSTHYSVLRLGMSRTFHVRFFFFNMNDFQWLSMLALYCEYWWMKKIQKDDCVTNCNSYMRSVGLVQVSLMFCAYIDHNIPWHQRVMPIVHCMAPCFLNIACEFLHMQFPSGCSCILHILQGIAQLLFQKFFSSTGFISIFVFQ